MNKILGLIPARGGSKSILRKNIQLLFDKPLIAWTIEAALRSHKLNRVIVSTEDEQIADVSKKIGAEVPFLRPVELAQDHIPTLSVLLHALSWLKERENYTPDIIVLLQPTSPLRCTEHIDQAIALLLESGADSVVSVCLAKQNPHWMKRLEGDRVYPFVENGQEYHRRQDLPPVYYLNGAVYVTRYEVLTNQNQIFGNDIRAIVMDPESSIDIDTLFDFKMAELFLKEQKYEL